MIYLWHVKDSETTQNAFRPSTSPQGRTRNVPRWHMSCVGESPTDNGLPRAQDGTLHHIIVVCSPESVLPDVLAMHTIEMIPKSMILSTPRSDRQIYNRCAQTNGCLSPIGANDAIVIVNATIQEIDSKCRPCMQAVILAT
jgi:hypothetical protein